MRPRTLTEVADLASKGDSFDLALANFLDQFYLEPRADSLKDRPVLLAPVFGSLGQIQDAYLAATAEELARAHRFRIPRWAFAPERNLRRPWFASTLAGLRSVLIVESPIGFRSRNLFVSGNALARA